MVAEQVILVKNEGAVRTIILNRPEVLNAINEAVATGLLKALRDVERENSVRCLVITGAGRAFCSGQDLAVVQQGIERGQPVDFGRLLRDFYHPVITKVRTLEKPVIASVNGAAAGGGCGLALACDIRLAAESASFVQAFINVGLVPDMGTTFTLPRLIGVSRAMEMAFTGRKVGAEEALRMGLVNQVVPDSRLAEETTRLANQLAAMPTRAIGFIKRAINTGWNADLEAQLDYEAMLQATADDTSDHREGVAAFFEKRPAKFTGQ